MSMACSLNEAKQNNYHHSFFGLMWADNVPVPMLVWNKKSKLLTGLVTSIPQQTIHKFYDNIHE